MDRGTKIFLFFFIVAMLGILGFVLTLGPTSSRFACEHARDQCELTHKFFFGYYKVQDWKFPESSIQEARLAKTLRGTGHARPPMVMEMVFKDGTTYNTMVDFTFRGRAEEKIAELNHYLKDKSLAKIEY